MTAWRKEAARLIETTTLPLAEVARLSGGTLAAVRMWYSQTYPADFRTVRKRDNYRKSKLGDKNPMKGKFGHQHHNFIGRASDNKGYYTVARPDWWVEGQTRAAFSSIMLCIA